MHRNAKQLPVVVAMGLLSTSTWGQITRWDTSTVIPGTESITPGPGLSLSFWNTDVKNLRYADFSGGLDLSNSRFTDSWLNNARFTNADLTGVGFSEAHLDSVDFNGATIRGAVFELTTYSGFTATQFYSTASYQTGDLREVGFYYNDLSGWDLSNQNLSGAVFTGTYLANTDLTGANIRGAVFRANTDRGLTAQQVYSTAMYQSGDLSGTHLRRNDLTGWDFSGMNLSSVRFDDSTLTDADFTGAAIGQANFSGTVANGFTAEQLYSTASYAVGDLQYVNFSHNVLDGWSFANQDLTGASFWNTTIVNADYSGATFPEYGLIASEITNASFRGADLYYVEFEDTRLSNVDFTGANLIHAYLRSAELSGVDFTLADMRDARLPSWMPDQPIMRNTILRLGQIAGLDLLADDVLKVRDMDSGRAITITDSLQMDELSQIEIVFADADWDSTITLDLPSGLLADLDGTLFLNFAEDADLTDLVGTTFNLFNWNGQLASGEAFAGVAWPAGFDWDISDLYDGGTVTLLAIPEPATVVLLALVAFGLRRR